MLMPNPRPRRILLFVTLATLAIFGGLLAGITWQLRGQLRDEVLRREAEAIHAVALMQLGSADLRLAEFGEEFIIDDLFAALLKSSELRGVFAVQLFDARGTLKAAKPIAGDELEETQWWPATLARPLARFVREGSLEMVSPQLALQATGVKRLPLLDIVVPLSATASGGAMGIGRYWVDGAPVAAEFARMDRRLARQAAVAFAGGAVLVGLVLGFAFSRLAEANRQLAEQTADLARANQELDFAAKTGALGAISAHLIHGLKNPLAGIEGFVTETATSGPEALRGEACRTAVETTRRLRLLVNEVTAVLRDEAAGEGDFGVPVAEVIEAARRRAVPLADQAGVVLSTWAEPGVEISGRCANLAGLVLANLLANAIEALDRDGGVSLEARRGESGAEFLVSDDGPGVPIAVKDANFRPVRSAKHGGGGMGLAISHRLAKHAGGDLQLVRSDQTGTTFRLVVPAVNAPVKAV